MRALLALLAHNLVARTSVAAASALSMALFAPVAWANGPVFADPTKSFEIDLTLPNARVCVAYPEAMTVEKDCDGVDLALARKLRPARTQLVLVVRETTEAGSLMWSASFASLAQPNQTMFTDKGAAELAEGIRAGAGKAAKRSASSTGLGGVGTHTLLVMRGAQVVRQTISLEAPVGEGEAPARVTMASLVGRGGLGVITVTALSPPTLDEEEVLTRLLDHTAVVPAAATKPSLFPAAWDPENPAYFVGYLVGSVGTFAVVLGAPFALLFWLARRMGKRRP